MKRFAVLTNIILLVAKTLGLLFKFTLKFTLELTSLNRKCEQVGVQILYLYILSVHKHKQFSILVP